ncbi:MAG: hypothetical protein LBH16_03990 [Treponema sp.]|jgi:hypothetical protein|nr:hypothetical protein [Treponema sp.]
MYRNHLSSNSAIPSEYRKAAERLFPKDGFFKGQKPDLKITAEFAKALGVGVEHQRLLAIDRGNDDMQTFLGHFQNNLDLLIQKTWVDKSDETRKNMLQDQVPSFVTTIEKGDYFRAFEEFNVILEELAYLFFGAQCEKDDFTEYTFRIDAQMGLFWWYGSRLASLKELKEKNGTTDDKILWALLLLGLCYLTNF